MSEREVVLEVKDLVKEFRSKNRSVKAVDGVSFYLKKEVTLALVGEAGFVKPATGRAVIKLVKPDGGEIRFKGQNIGEMSKKQFRPLCPRLQMIFQDPYGSLNPRMKIRKLLEEAAAYGVKPGESLEKTVEELIKSVGLTADDLDRYPHEFSGGQRQRICIARAIATRPDIIICDEPVSALDLLVQAQILKLLKELQKKYGFAYIFISHNLSVVRYMSDRIAVMCMGRIVEEGTTEEIFNDPRHDYTKLLLNSVLDTEGRENSERENYGDKYYEAAASVSGRSNKRIDLSETHYVLGDI